MSHQENLSHREKVFRDPVHNYIYIQDAIILELIDTPEFQRLRRIKQLGTSSYVFHGAEHSRFNHSLGVYEITRRFINNFATYYSSQKSTDGLWDNEERLVALCAALLHDVGHGPFSHTFEQIFATNHEDITIQIILDPTTQIHQVLLRAGADFPQKIASVINQTYPNQQVVQLISSQIDADRMDYLLRDAYYTGVSYGKFDLTRIARVIRPHNHEILFEYSGMHAIEDYILSRYQMYMQIYFHPTSRGMEAILQKLLERVQKLFKQNPEDLALTTQYFAPFISNNWTLKDYLKLDDYMLGSFFIQWTEHRDSILADLANRFVNRIPFDSIFFNDETKRELTISLQQELINSGFDPDYYLVVNSSFDLPYDFYQPGRSTTLDAPIRFLTRTNQVVELSQISPLVQALKGKIHGDKRLFFPREVLNQIKRLPKASRNSHQKNILAATQNQQQTTFHMQNTLFEKDVL